MSIRCAESDYLFRLTGEKDSARAFELYFAHSQPQVRRALDVLLSTIVPEERHRAVELAGSVEVFCLPSNAVESRVFVNPGAATGYLIGIAPLTVQLSADIAWGMNMVHPYATETGAHGWDAEAGREKLDEHILGYVRALQAADDSPLPASLVSIALSDRPQWPYGQGPSDCSEAAMAFVIAHELGHIEHGDLFPADRTKAQTLFPEDLAVLLRLSGETNEELAADASAFMPCYNYLMGTWLVKTGPSTAGRFSLKRLLQKVEYQRVARHSARRAAEACEAYYSAVLVLGTLKWLGGDNDTANRLLTAGMRAPFIQFYVQRDRQEVLVPQVGSFMWSTRDVAYRKAHHAWRVRFASEVMLNAWVRMGLEIPETDPVVIQQDNLAERLKDKEVAARIVEDAREWLAERETLGAHHSSTLQRRIEFSYYLEMAGNTVGALAAAENLLPEVARETGHDSDQTLALRHNISFLLGKAERTREAAASFTGLLADQERLRGADHPDALESRYNLASLRGRAGDAGGAAADLAQLAADQERVQGHEHAHTRAAQKSLAYWRIKAQDEAGTVAQLVKEREGTLGPDHPDTLAARRDLADMRREAVSVAEVLFDEQKAVLGPDHPDTRTTLRSLAEWRGKAGDEASP
ncbi:hypothetical protein [Streptomyces sp. NPDC005989]|uniref:hypothetical protein n=1 Tax=Streptomyces sp. NPDC005989 TaxID=3156727 RepID=UPI0033DB6425